MFFCGNHWSIKHPGTVSNWNLNAAEPEWFMHLSFLICWNKVSTFLFHCTSQAIQRRGGRVNALEENGKVNRAICPAASLFSSILSWTVQRLTLWLIRKSCQSFRYMISHRVLVDFHSKSFKRIYIYIPHSWQKQMSTALIPFNFDEELISVLHNYLFD